MSLRDDLRQALGVYADADDNAEDLIRAVTMLAEGTDAALVASVKEAEAERDHLAALIEQAPHGPDCDGDGWDDPESRCTCWKSHAGKERTNAQDR